MNNRAPPTGHGARAKRRGRPKDPHQRRDSLVRALSLALHRQIDRTCASAPRAKASVLADPDSRRERAALAATCCPRTWTPVVTSSPRGRRGLCVACWLLGRCRSAGTGARSCCSLRLRGYISLTVLLQCGNMVHETHAPVCMSVQCVYSNKVSSRMDRQTHCSRAGSRWISACAWRARKPRKSCSLRAATPGRCATGWWTPAAGAECGSSTTPAWRHSDPPCRRKRQRRRIRQHARAGMTRHCTMAVTPLGTMAATRVAQQELWQPIPRADVTRTRAVGAITSRHDGSAAYMMAQR